VARSFANLYRNNTALFPRDAASPNDDYEKRIRASYPLHPELLDRLYEDWSTLERFQRTVRAEARLVDRARAVGIERRLAADPARQVPLEATTVNSDLTQYLEDQWKPIMTPTSTG
jgi:hypothetical protein